MKYDFKLDMFNENSVSIILNQIRPKTKVLEFGPAMGRMTKYLKEELECEVYIVEIDEEGFKSSMQFAIDGVLGNAETLEWVDKFKEIKFDYIIFADVIEHLKNPEEAILNAKNLLEFQGRLIVSVPNVAHNSVIIDLINNKFNYSEVGLLDNTHIKFFTYYTLQEILSKCNLIICNERATYAKPYETEFLNNYDQISRDLADKLKAKEYGDVYQYVFTSIKKEDYILDSENIIIEKNIKKILPLDTFKIYIDNGSGFNENNTLIKQIFMGKNQLCFNLGTFYINNQIRLDFTEESCIVKLDRLIIDGKDYNVKNLSGNFSYSIQNLYVFLNADPFLFIQKIPTGADNILIEFSVYKLYSNDLEIEYLNISNTDLINVMSTCENLKIEKDKAVFELINKLEKIESELKYNKDELINKSKELKYSKDELIKKEEELEYKKNELVTKDEELKLKNTVIEQREKELFQLNKKITDEYNSSKKLIETIDKLNQKINELQDDCNKKNDTINSINSKLEKLNSNFIVKLNNKLFG